MHKTVYVTQIIMMEKCPGVISLVLKDYFFFLKRWNQIAYNSN